VIEVDMDRSTPRCLVVRCGGKITGAEYTIFLDDFDTAAKTAPGSLSAVFVLESTPSYGDIEAFKGDWRFGTHEYGRLRRVAYVGDVGWIKALVKTFGWLTRAEERTFSSSEFDDAREWASAEAAP